MKAKPGALRARVAAKAAIFRGEQILLLHRSPSASDPGVWDLPGGIVQRGESLSTAARREVREETGLAVRLGPLVHVELFGSMSRHGKIRPTVGVFFRGQATARLVPRLDPHEHTDFAWVAREDLHSYPTVPYLDRAVRAAFSTKPGSRSAKTEEIARLHRSASSHVHLPVPA
jgi:8-oxo-dGTP diphosphatase